MAKRDREIKLRMRRQEKQAKKEARKLASASPPDDVSTAEGATESGAAEGRSEGEARPSRDG